MQLTNVIFHVATVKLHTHIYVYYTTSRVLLITFQNKLNVVEFLYWFTAGTRLVPYSDQNAHVPFKRAWSARASEGMLTHAEGLLNQRLHLVVTFPVHFTQ
jgi:hypothetical protein